MSFTFDNTIPAANNNPSSDQPLMLQNNVSTQAILAVDHITFNQSNGGQHLQVTLPATTYVVPGAQVGNASVIYPNAGTASSAAQLFHKNSNATVQLSAIRAWGYCDGAGNIIASQSVNVASVNNASLGRYTVTLTANAVSSADFAILTSAQVFIFGTPFFRVGSYVITNVGVFDLYFFNDSGGLTGPSSFSFQVLQI